MNVRVTIDVPFLTPDRESIPVSPLEAEAVLREVLTNYEPAYLGGVPVIFGLPDFFDIEVRPLSC